MNRAVGRGLLAKEPRDFLSMGGGMAAGLCAAVAAWETGADTSCCRESRVEELVGCTFPTGRTRALQQLLSMFLFATEVNPHENRPIHHALEHYEEGQNFGLLRSQRRAVLLSLHSKFVSYYPIFSTNDSPNARL